MHDEAACGFSGDDFVPSVLFFETLRQGLLESSPFGGSGAGSRPSWLGVSGSSGSISFDTFGGCANTSFEMSMSR